MYLIFLLLTIYIIDIYITVTKVNIYPNNGALTRWRHHVCTTPVQWVTGSNGAREDQSLLFGFKFRYPNQSVIFH